MAPIIRERPQGNVAKGNLAMFEWDATGALAKVAAPILVIGGGWDIVTKPQASETIANASGAAFEIVDGVNHMGFLERPDLYNGLIADFAERAFAVPAPVKTQF